MRRSWIACALFLALGCGDGASSKNNGNNGDNNGGTNNGTANNGASNNASNNGTANNGTANNGTANNGTANNGGTNNGTTNNGTTNNGTTNNGMGDLDPDLQRLEDGVWDAFCEAMFQCPNRNTVQLIAFVGGRFASEADCKASAYRGEVDLMQSQLGLDAGRVIMDPSKIDDCAAAFKTVYCDPQADPAPLAAACDGLWTGQVQEGGACVQNEECAGDSACAAPDDCAGTCSPTSGPDPTCGNETCNLATEYCGQQGNMMRCLGRKMDGQACSGDVECLDGSGCRQTAMGGICTAFGSQQEGMPCGGDFRFCDPDLICAGQLMSQCQPLTFGADGETCNFQGAACEPGLACQDIGLAGGTCGAARAENEDCQGSFQCQIGLYCDGFDIAMPQNLGSCLPRKVDGQTCASNDECASEFCTEPGDTMGTCAPKEYCAVP